MIKDSAYPSSWLKNGHLQTIWASSFRKKISLNGRWETLDLADGDFLDLVWFDEAAGLNETTPVVIFIHGMEATLDSPYIRPFIKALNEAGYICLFYHMRNCSPRSNRLERSYHSGETGDLKEVIGHAEKCLPSSPIHILGISLGGNILLKYLGECGDETTIKSAAAVSPAFDIKAICNHLGMGVRKIYQNYYMKKLIAGMLKKIKAGTLKMDPDRVMACRTFMEFDELLTAPLNGFKSADHYYEQVSCKRFIPDIKVPTLIHHCIDDPIIPPDSIPGEVPPSVIMELSKHGGHVASIAGVFPFFHRYWLEERVVEFFNKPKGFSGK